MANFIGMKNSIFILVLAGIVLAGCKGNKPQSAEGKNPVQNVLTPEEQAQGWMLLFDGTSLDQWKCYNADSIPSNWVVEDGCIKATGKGGDATGYIVTREDFQNFHLSLEFKLTPGANSGIFYGVTEGKYPVPYATGPEYQLIDNEGFPEKLEEWQKLGADYAMHVAQNVEAKPIGEWNKAEIIVNGTHVEHWLNGKKIVEFERWTPEWEQLKKEGKWKDYPDYGIAKSGKIGLQDHGSVVYFRNIKILKLS